MEISDLQKDLKGGHLTGSDIVVRGGINKYGGAGRGTDRKSLSELVYRTSRMLNYFSRNTTLMHKVPSRDYEFI